MTHEVTEAQITAALFAHVPGGAAVWHWLPTDDQGQKPHPTARNVMRCALEAAMHSATPAVAPEGPVTEGRPSSLSLEAYARWASRALNRLSGGGSEMFLKLLNGEYYADPDMAVQRAQERIDTIRRLNLTTPAPADEDAELVSKLWRLHVRGLSYASDTPCVNLLLADLSEGLKLAAERLASKGADEGLRDLRNVICSAAADVTVGSIRQVFDLPDYSTAALSKSNGEKG